MSKGAAIGAVIREARKGAGLSQAELAQKVGYANQSSISYLETGALELSIETAVRIAGACGVPPERLVADLARATEQVPA